MTGKYEGKWVDLFSFEKYNGEDHPQCKGKILFRTPAIDYFFDKEQFIEFKKKVNQVGL